tara:strand:- start:411 stop:1079 length:669 start_codon:yes stop_codon:yes gene_type:complete
MTTLSKFGDVLPQLLKYKLVIWDFDGVIKDSVEPKSIAYTDLFGKIDSKIKKKIENHHYQNGGISRYKKIPLYLSFNNIYPNDENINLYVNKFSNIVVKKVIESQWVPGMPTILKLLNEMSISKNIIISATPQTEIEFIVKELDIAKYFTEIVGTSDNKSKHISRLIKSNSVLPSECVFIGDSFSDYKESITSKVDFIYRNINCDLSIIKEKCLYQIKDFLL